MYLQDIYMDIYRNISELFLHNISSIGIVSFSVLTDYDSVIEIFDKSFKPLIKKTNVTLYYDEDAR